MGNATNDDLLAAEPPEATQLCCTEAPKKFALAVEMLMETAANYSNHGQHEKVGAFDCSCIAAWNWFAYSFLSGLG